MKKRTKWILGGLAIALMAGIAYGATRGGTNVVVVTDVVKRGDLRQTVEVTGDTQSVIDVDLAFNTSGSVAAINVDVGDMVRAGDVLAVLSDAKLSAAVTQAANAVDQAQAQLDVKLAGSTDEEIAVYEATVASAQAAVDAAESDLANAEREQIRTQVTGDTNVAAAQDDLAHMQTATTENVSHAQEDELEALRSLIAEIRSGLGKADEILGIENTLANQEFDQDLSTGDSQALVDAEDAYKAAALRRDATEEALLAADATDAASLAEVAEMAQEAYEYAYETLLATSRVLTATTADSATLSLDDLSAMKASIATAIASLTADGSAALSARQALEDAQRAAIDDVRDAENALAKAEASRDQNNTSAITQVAGARSTLAVRQADLVKAQAQLAQIQADPRSVDLAGLEAAVSQAQAQYAAAIANAADAQIVSPIDGQVTSIMLDRGEQATLGSTVMTVLGASEQFEIVMDIPEADIAKIKVGQESEVTFDAFGEDRVFPGSVLSVDPAEKLIEGVVFYEAKVLLVPGTDLVGVKPGMSANVTIETGEKTQVLFIPKRAILEQDGVKYVRIPTGTDGSYDRRDVTVGMYADDGSAEVTSGLSEGETVIVTIR